MILAARYVVPMGGAAIVDGAVRVEAGRIVEVAPKAGFGTQPIEDLGDVVLLPGLINAHAHLELSAYAGRIKPSGLWLWLTRLVKLRRKADPEVERAEAARGARELLRAGVTCVADISRQGDTWSSVLDVPIRDVCFAELISVAKQPPRNPTELERAVDAIEQAQGDRCRLMAGVSPHSPYTVTTEHLVGAVEVARRRGVPLTTHWAETKEECRWLARGGGRLGAMIWALGGKDVIRSPRCDPIEYAERLGLLSGGALLAHVNYISNEGLGRLAGSAASVVYCPRSHRFFGHKGHRWREMLDAGVNVCIGTDSSASLPAGSRLSILDELRFLSKSGAGVDAELLLSMATIRAARALRLEGQLGSLTPGKQADMIAIRLGNRLADDPLADVLGGDIEPCGVWVGGERIVDTSTGS
ncbi:MAG: amidohydrolase family protein [Phycisphaerae bacterium]|nr:amidohydrolase family protein [Phycisphaerae bacterium]